ARSAGVVQQLLSIEFPLRHVLQTRDEELQCAALVYGKQFSERLHGTSASAAGSGVGKLHRWLHPSIAGLVPAHRLHRTAPLSPHTSARHRTGRQNVGDLGEIRIYVWESASSAPNSERTMAVAPQTRAPPPSNDRTFVTTVCG